MRGLSDRVILCDWKTSPNPNPKVTLYVEDKRQNGGKEAKRKETRVAILDPTYRTVDHMECGIETPNWRRHA